MYITSRSYLTAGIAALGVGAIALSPVQPVPALDQDRVTRSLAAALTAESTPIDPITPWVDTFQTSIANIGALFDFYASNPLYTSPLGLTGDFNAVFPLLQTIIANQITYFEELTNGNAGLIPEQIWGNVQTFFNAPWSPGDPAGEYISETAVATIPVVDIPISQQFVFALLPTILGQETYDELEPIINFTATYYSGQLVGLLGPVFAPLIELTRSFTAIGEYFEAGDVTGAINELINIPANVTNAVLNGGGFLDLTGVVNAVSPLPPEVESIGLNLGGLISPPVPQDGSLIDPDDAPTAYNGGVLFDSLAAEISYKISDRPLPDGTSVDVTDPGIPVSWIGAAVGLGQFLGGEMLVTPPAPPTEAAAVTAAAEVEVEVDVEATGLEAPAEEAPADETPAIEALADELKIDDLVADDEAPAPKAAAAVDAPAPSKATADDDPAPKPAASVGSDDAGDANDAD
jgi:hypothetical protein